MGNHMGESPKSKEKIHMKLKNMWKRFWTLDVHNHEGFTLVELIIVIAILAILSTGAIAGYSAYVEKANKTADQALVAEVKNALMLAYYSNSDAFKGGVVVLSPDNYATADGLEDAMAAAFGANWATSDALKLKNDGWNADFQGSSFYDDEEGLKELLDTVEGLTTALQDFLANETLGELLAANGEFNAYMDKLDADTAPEKADAAVFYVANTTAQLSADDLDKAIDALDLQKSPEANLDALNKALGGSSLTSMAAMYALAQGYANYYDANAAKYPLKDGADTPAEILKDATDDLTAAAGSYLDQYEAFEDLFVAFQKMANVDRDGTAVTDYMGLTCDTNFAKQDMNAYADAMKTVASAEGSILEKNGELGSNDYFASPYISGILSNYSNGCIFVYAHADENGVMQFSSSIDEK